MNGLIVRSGIAKALSDDGMAAGTSEDEDLQLFNDFSEDYDDSAEFSDLIIVTLNCSIFWYKN